jgi:hypothetical protein
MNNKVGHGQVTYQMKQTYIQFFIEALPLSVALSKLPVSIHSKTRFPVQILSFHVTLKLLHIRKTPELNGKGAKNPMK